MKLFGVEAKQIRGEVKERNELAEKLKAQEKKIFSLDQQIRSNKVVIAAYKEEVEKREKELDRATNYLTEIINQKNKEIKSLKSDLAAISGLVGEVEENFQTKTTAG